MLEEILLPLRRTRWKQNAVTLKLKMFLPQRGEHAQYSELSSMHLILLLGRHREKEYSSVTRGLSRHSALQLSELASSWATVCLTFSVGHMEPGAGNRVLGLGPHWSENSASDCWPALKYLVLITATTFTLEGYCWNIIPKGLRSKGITPLFNHRGDGSHSLSQAFFI